MSKFVFECKDLVKRYDRKIALNGVNLGIEEGRIIGLLGPNGSGKTTLIKLANGLLKPEKGEILISGMNVGVATKSIVSYLPDKDYLPENMKISELITLFADFYEDFDKENAKNMIAELGIEEKDKFKQLSKGNREKVQLILVMSRRAKIYFLDEPIGGVDPVTRDYILNSIIRNYGENATVIIATHLINDVEKILDEVVFIKNGKIILHDSVDNIREREGKSIDEVFREVFA